MLAVKTTSCIGDTVYWMMMMMMMMIIAISSYAHFTCVGANFHGGGGVSPSALLYHAVTYPQNSVATQATMSPFGIHIFPQTWF